MAFPSSDAFTVPEWPDVESVNARGDFDLAYPRLAFIDGDSDPWRPAVRPQSRERAGSFADALWQTPQSDYAIKRNDTLSMPVKLIKGKWPASSDRPLVVILTTPDHARRGPSL